ncbi:MAG: SoxR reducing system RseC family protein [Desulfosarcinaceae bacterium]|nr:SoxR reducing system RseC family protein [Desulfosarcinaceae bacterium]
MATEKGIVIRLGEPESGIAWVLTQRSSACKSCSSRHSCNPSERGKDMEVEALNVVGAQVGDEIVLSLDTGPLLKATFLLYVVPILCMIIGAALGHRYALARGWDPSGLSAVVSLIALGISFFFIRLRGNRLSSKRAYKPQIVRIAKTA